MPRVTARARTLVWFEVRGEDVPLKGGIVYPNDDGGLAGLLVEFLQRHGIMPAASAGFFRPGDCAFGVEPQDAPVVANWLKKYGVLVEIDGRRL